MFLNGNCIFPVCFITRERCIRLYNRERIHKIDHPAAKNMLTYESEKKPKTIILKHPYRQFRLLHYIRHKFQKAKNYI